MLTAMGTEVSLTVFELKTKKKHKHPLKEFDLTSPLGQSFAISGDGRFVAAGQANILRVWERNTTVKGDLQ
jgi:hypothetical protein